MENRIAQMEGHTIICGFGKMGNSIVQQLTSANFPIVVIETDPEREEEIKELQCNYIIGNADNDETLIAAGIQNAANLVSVISSDPENVFIALTARNLNPRINIIARANHTSAEGKLIQAGANRVISPYALTSAKITKQILSPLVEDFLDTVHLDQSINFKLSGFFIEEDSPYVNKTLLETDLREKGIIIIGIRKKDGERIFAPSAHSKIEAGDHLISFGNEFTG